MNKTLASWAQVIRFLKSIRKKKKQEKQKRLTNIYYSDYRIISTLKVTSARKLLFVIKQRLRCN